MKIKFILVNIIVATLFFSFGCSAKKTNEIFVELPAQSSEMPTVKPIQALTPEKTDPLFDSIVLSENLASYFEKYDNATMILSDGTTKIIYNEPFSVERHSPYSTFKIPNSLIALEENVISIENSLREWDGVKHSREELNQNQDLASAIKYSCVWYYQQMARKVGQNTMQTYLDDLQYGNQDISSGIDSFWLGSSLLISPQEQLDFIIELYKNELPFSTEHMEYVKSIMRQEDYSIRLYGKTGSSGQGQGWFVGYALFNEKPIFFATYIEGNKVSGLLARDITVKILTDFFS